MKISTEINGLDEILHGGFIKPSAILIAGPAGSGKTTMCMQMLFNAAKKGETCIFFSMLSESSSMIIRSMSQYSFFDNNLIESGKLKIINIERGIIEKGDFAIYEFIRDKVLKYNPSIVVIDPITILEYIIKTFEERKLDYPEKRGFALSLFSEFEAWDALLLMTGELSGNELTDNPWSYMVDGVIFLDKHSIGKERQRYIEVSKMRGSDFFKGEHTYRITGDGIKIFPRFMPSLIDSEIESGKIKTGIKNLDKMMKGGLPKSSATMVAGSAGCGKSVLGLHFIANGILNKEPCLIISFESEAKEIIKSAESFGLDLEKYEKEDILRFIYQPYGYVSPDELVLQIQEIVDDIGVKRVLIESISGFSQAIPDPEELRMYILSLTKYFRNHNISSIFTYELPEIIGPINIPDTGLPFVMDSIILLRNIEIEAGIKKSLLVLKLQGSDFDSDIKEFTISDRGIEILDSLKEFRGLTSDTPVVSEHFKEALKAGKKLFK